jgi:hypothetical protein
MFDVFSTREIASLIWFTVLMVYVTIHSNGKVPVREFLKALCNRLFVIPVLCLLGYAALLVNGLSQFAFWDWILIKDVIVWVLFVATPICFKLGTKRTNDFPFRKIVAENFTSSAILEFFVGAFTFSFDAEMIAVPAFSLLVIMQNYDRSNPKYQSLHKVIDGISVVVGFVLLWFTIDVAIEVISTEGIADVLVSFCIPVLFSIAYLPVIYYVAVKALYHDLFVRIRIRNIDGEKILSLKKKAVRRACGISYWRIQEFSRSYTHDFIGKVCFGNDDNSFFDFVDSFRKGGRVN